MYRIYSIKTSHLGAYGNAHAEELIAGAKYNKQWEINAESRAYSMRSFFRIVINEALMMTANATRRYRLAYAGH